MYFVRLSILLNAYLIYVPVLSDSLNKPHLGKLTFSKTVF